MIKYAYSTPAPLHNSGSEGGCCHDLNFLNERTSRFPDGVTWACLSTAKAAGQTALVWVSLSEMKRIPSHQGLPTIQAESS